MANASLDLTRLHALIESACEGLGADVQAPIIAETLRTCMTASPLTRSTKPPSWLLVPASSTTQPTPAPQLVCCNTPSAAEILGEEVTHAEMATASAEYFPTFIKKGIGSRTADDKMGQFDLVAWRAALKFDRDLNFDYLGLQTLYDRYFLHTEGKRIEMPQAFFMRVAMGLALNEIDREARAIEFYELLSSFDFMSSTPTLFNSGTRRSQLFLLPDHRP